MGTEPTDSDWTNSLDTGPAALGTIYGVLSRCFSDPTDRLHEALTTGELEATFEELLAQTDLDVDVPPLRTDRERERLSARYNDLFVIGFTQVLDRTDGTQESQGPPVPLYESAYRSDVSWSDVNLDLARAYDYFGLEIDESDRDHHDYLPLQLEFMGYLCRREAAVDPDVAPARLDFQDRHLRVVTEGVVDRLADQDDPGVYGELGSFLDAVTLADVAALDERVSDR